MKLVFSRFVEDDLDAIAASIAEDNPTRAVLNGTYFMRLSLK